MHNDRVGYTCTWTVDWTTELCGRMEHYRWRIESGLSKGLRAAESLKYSRVKSAYELKTS